MCASERSERALKIYEFSLVFSIMFNDIQKVSKFVGPLFVGAPGQLPTLPSPKSDPGYYAEKCMIILLFSVLFAMTYIHVNKIPQKTRINDSSWPIYINFSYSVPIKTACPDDTAKQYPAVAIYIRC